MNLPINESGQVALYRRAARIELYRRDYERFAHEQQWISTKRNTVERFDLFPTQKMVEAVIQEQLKEHGWIRVVEFKARQHGGSTHGVSRACHKVFLDPTVSALILAQDDSTASNLFDMAQRFYDRMEPDIKPVRRYLNKQEIVLENPDPKTRGEFPGLGSRISIQSAKNIHAAVGTTRNWVHISEMCRYGNVKELWGSLVPAIPLIPGTAIINESAPFGYGEGRDAFRAACDAARSGKSIEKFVGIYWWMCPEYVLPLDKHDTVNVRFLTTATERRLIADVKRTSKVELGKEWVLSNEQLKYRRLRIQQLSPGDDAIGTILFQQQFPSNYEEGWVQFMNLIFPTHLTETMRRRDERPPIRRCDIIADEVIDRPAAAPLWIWENPEAGETYDIGVDTAAGTGGNYSAFQVFKRSNNEQVAEYHSNKIGPLDYAKVVYSVGLFYNSGHVIVEVEGIGYAVNEALNQMGYPNIYRWRKRDHAGGGILSPLTGWKTQYDTKRLLVAVAQDVVSHDAIIIHSSRLYNEMRYFCQDFSDMGNEVFYASEGDDDLAMAMMITQVGMRDEKFIEFPMERGAQLNRPDTLAERNKRMADALERQSAFNDNADKEGVSPQLSHADMAMYREKGISGTPMERVSEDPWLRLEKAMKNEDY